jgi:hypothetical protein
MIKTLQDIFTPLHLQGTAITPVCDSVDACGSGSLGFQCTSGSDYLVFFELAGTTCEETPNPLNAGCIAETEASAGGRTDMICDVTDCINLSCNGISVASYDLFCDENDTNVPGNADIEECSDISSPVTIECEAGNATCDDLNPS